MVGIAYSPKVLALIVGAVAIVVGLIGFTGLVPGLAVVPCQNPALCSHAGVVGVSPQFTVAANSTTKPSVVVSDHTVLGPGLASFATVSIGWGDSIGLSGIVGGTFAHTYAAPGTYNVIDLVTAHICLTTPPPGASCAPNGPVITGSLNRLVTIPGNNTVKCASNNCTKSPTPSVVAAFSWTVTNLSLTVTDHSTVQGATVSSISWRFGDGFSGIGSTVTHTFTNPGTYNVTEIVTGQTNPPNAFPGVQGTVANLITVTAGQNQTTSGVTPSSSLAPPSSQFSNPLAAALVVFGVVEIIVVLVWKGNVAVLAGILIALAGGGAAYGLLFW